MAKYSLYDLQESVKEAVRECFEHDPDAEPSDVAHKVADGWVPVYNDDLIQTAADTMSLATDVPELGPAFDGSPTACNIIAANIYERLLDAAWEVINEREGGELI